MLDLPAALLDVADAADAARRARDTSGARLHSDEDVLVAAGMPRPRHVDRETIVGRLVVDKGLRGADDIQWWRETVSEILTLAGL